MNKTERLFATLLLLQTKLRMRPSEIAAHFEVTTRTVYRDIQALCESGVPIVSEPGAGYSIMEGYFLPPLLFTPREATILWIGTEFVREQTDPSYKADAESAFLKIESVLPEKTRHEIRTLKERISLRYREPPAYELDTTHLDAIREATLKGNLIRMRYSASSGKEDTEREIEPLGLIFSDRFWYVVAYCRLRKAVRTFRTDRIRDLRVLDERFPPRKDFSIQDYISRDQSGDRRRGQGIPVKILFSPESAAKAKKAVPWRIVGEETIPEGGVVLIVMVEDFSWIIKWILSFGKEAEVMEPQSLKDDILHFLADLSDHHGKNGTLASE